MALALAAAQARDGTAADLARAERSFSPYRFGVNVAKQRGLRPVNPACRHADCDYVDAHHVRHVGGQANELAIKVIEVAEFGPGEISALGIGRARSDRDVAKRVRAFLPGVTYDCDKNPGESRKIAQSCGAMLGQGWIKLLFDHHHQLRTVRIDAYQID